MKHSINFFELFILKSQIEKEFFLLYFDNLVEYCFPSIGKNSYPETQIPLTDNQKTWIDSTFERIPAVKARFFNNKQDLQEAVSYYAEDKKNEEVFFVLLTTRFPNLVSYKHVHDNNIRNALAKEKAHFAIDANLANGIPYEKIKEDLKLNENICDGYSVPAIIENKDLEIKKLKKINNVRTFFIKYPYASVSEASKTLNINNKEIREIINNMESEGEVVKYSNVLRTIEYEIIKKKIIEKKMEDPMISDKELALDLEVSISTVRQAIQEAVQMMKIENSQNFTFMAHQSAQQFELVEKEAYQRHKATKNSSSEWLKIMISARQAIVEMYGLKEPDKINITHKNDPPSKEDVDSLVSAWLATDALDVDFQQIERNTKIEEESCT